MMHPGLGWCVIERAWRYEAHLGATDLAPASGPVQCLARSSPDVEEHVTIPVAMQKRPGCDYRTWRLCRSRMPTYGHGDTCCPDTATEARRATSICVHFSTSPCTRAHRRSGQTPGHRVVRTTLHGLFAEVRDLVRVSPRTALSRSDRRFGSLAARRKASASGAPAR